MLTTAAGTITPARVLIIGARRLRSSGHRHLQQLGAVVSAYDLRGPPRRSRCTASAAALSNRQSKLGDAQDAGGYAKAQDEDFYRRQRELLGQVVGESDVVITAAVVPGKKSPVLVTLYKWLQAWLQVR